MWNRQPSSFFIWNIYILFTSHLIELGCCGGKFQAVKIRSVCMDNYLVGFFFLICQRCSKAAYGRRVFTKCGAQDFFGFFPPLPNSPSLPCRHTPASPCLRLSPSPSQSPPSHPPSLGSGHLAATADLAGWLPVASDAAATLCYSGAKGFLSFLLSWSAKEERRSPFCHPMPGCKNNEAWAMKELSSSRDDYRTFPFLLLGQRAVQQSMWGRTEDSQLIHHGHLYVFGSSYKSQLGPNTKISHCWSEEKGTDRGWLLIVISDLGSTLSPCPLIAMGLHIPISFTR